MPAHRIDTHAEAEPMGRLVRDVATGAFAAAGIFWSCARQRPGSLPASVRGPNCPPAVTGMCSWCPPCSPDAAGAWVPPHPVAPTAWQHP